MTGSDWRLPIAVALATSAIAAMLGEELAGAIVQGFVLLCLALIFVRLRQLPEPDRRAWRPFVWAGLSIFVGATARFVHGALIGVPNPLPSPADVLFFVGYSLIFLGLLNVVRTRVYHADLDAWLDSVMVAVALGLSMWILVLSDYLRDPSAPLGERVLNLVYLLISLTIVAASIRVLIAPGIRVPSNLMMGAAMGIFVAADLGGTLLYAWGASVLPVIVSSPVIYGLFLAALQHPSMPELSKRPAHRETKLRARRLVALGAALVAPTAATLWADTTIVDGLVVVAATVLMASVVLSRVSRLVSARDRAIERELVLKEFGQAVIEEDEVERVREAMLAAVPRILTSTSFVAAGLLERFPSLSWSAGIGAIEMLPDCETQVGVDAVDFSDHSAHPLFEGTGDTRAYGLALHSSRGSTELVVVLVDGVLDGQDAAALESLAAQGSLAVSAVISAAQRRRMRNERRITALVEQSADLVVVTSEDGRVTYVSPNADRVLRGAGSELTSGLEVLAHAEDRVVLSAEIRSTTAGLGSTPREIRLKTGDGTYRWFDVSVRDFRHEPEVGGLVVTARDITEERTAKENLERSEAWFRSLVQSSSDVIAVLDDLGIITYISPAVHDLLGFHPDSLAGRSALEIIPGDELHRLDELRTDMERGTIGSRDIELRLVAADGTDRVVDITLSDLRDEPSVSGLVLNVRDITDRKSLEHDLRHQALHDELTGLGNRLQFSEDLRGALNDPFERGQLAVLFVDIDDFKTVNDSLGHSAGDEVLVEVANRLRTGLRPTDRTARLGGDEFAVLFTEIEGEDQLGRMADRLVRDLSSPVKVRGIDVQVSVSIGIATDDDRVHSAEDLLRSADVAMYQAKDRGKGRWALFEESMHERARERFDLQNALSTALDDPEEMVPHFQPIVDLATGRIFGVEALLRWFHPELGLVSPAAFIPLAEETGMIIEIGRHVLERSLAQLAEWQSMGHDIYVSVNVSAVQLQTDGIVSDILGLVDHYGVARHKLVLELTETSLVNDFRSVITRIDALREAGVQVAIDDFGTGYSSLRYANEFRVDILKIDRAFVVDLEFAEESTVISTVIELARRMGAKTVAEGIELPMMPPRLLRLGCQLGQGYLFAKPVAAEHITTALAAEREGQTLVGLGR